MTAGSDGCLFIALEELVRNYVNFCFINDYMQVPFSRKYIKFMRQRSTKLINPSK